MLFPDPWKKKRHKKRRLISLEFVDQMYNILEENGQVIVATDCNEYFDLIKANFLKKQLFKETFVNPNADNNIVPELVETKYFLRAIKAGKKTKFSRFQKKLHK